MATTKAVHIDEGAPLTQLLQVKDVTAFHLLGDCVLAGKTSWEGPEGLYVVVKETIMHQKAVEAVSNSLRMRESIHSGEVRPHISLAVISNCTSSTHSGNSVSLC